MKALISARPTNKKGAEAPAYVTEILRIVTMAQKIMEYPDDRSRHNQRGAGAAE